MSVNNLLSGMVASDWPVAFEALVQFARKEEEDDLVDLIGEIQRILEEEKAILAREVIEEVKPVPEVRSALRQMSTTDAQRHNNRRLPKSKVTTIPEIRSESPSLKSDEARFAIQNLRETLKVVNQPLAPARERQRQLEESSLNAAEREMKHAAEQMHEKKLDFVTDAQKLRKINLQSWMHEWHGKLTTRLTERISELRDRTPNTDQVWSSDLPIINTLTGESRENGMREGPLRLHLELLPPDRLALITILEIMRMLGTGGVAHGMKATRGMITVGRAIELEYRAETVRNVVGVKSREWQRLLDPSTQTPDRRLLDRAWKSIGETKQGKATSTGLSEDLHHVWAPSWSNFVSANVGAFLIENLIGVAQVDMTYVDPELDEER